LGLFARHTHSEKRSGACADRPASRDSETPHCARRPEVTGRALPAADGRCILAGSMSSQRHTRSRRLSRSASGSRAGTRRPTPSAATWYVQNSHAPRRTHERVFSLVEVGSICCFVFHALLGRAHRSPWVSMRCWPEHIDLHGCRGKRRVGCPATMLPVFFVFACHCSQVCSPVSRRGADHRRAQCRTPTAIRRSAPRSSAERGALAGCG
jgi:hypothetical protein